MHGESKRGNSNMVKLLLERGAKIDARTKVRPKLSPLPCSLFRGLSKMEDLSFKKNHLMRSHPGRPPVRGGLLPCDALLDWSLSLPCLSRPCLTLYPASLYPAFICSPSLQPTSLCPASLYPANLCPASIYSASLTCLSLPTIPPAVIG